MKKERSGICLYQRPVHYLGGSDVRRTNTKTNEGSRRVCKHVCHGWSGRRGGDSCKRTEPTISITLDDALTPSIGSDVKHGKYVPDSISAHSSDSYQRASSVSIRPFQTHRHTSKHTPPTSHRSIFTLHWNRGMCRRPRGGTFI